MLSSKSESGFTLQTGVDTATSLIINQLEGMSEKPIIFICHSLGGIIVKRVSLYYECTLENIVNLPELYNAGTRIL